MGSFHRDDEQMLHEGYIIGLERDPEAPGGLRELGYPDERRDVEVNQVQAVCECGWRSPRIYAPLGARWSPSMVFIPRERDRDEIMGLWATHVEEALARDPKAWPRYVVRPG